MQRNELGDLGGQRRRLMTALATGATGALTGALVGAQARAHQMAGRVDPPLPAPPLPVRWHDGRSRALADVLAGRVTALQMMFTSCTATCPIQGALFASLRDRIGAALPGVQLVSLSLEPLVDTPAALSAWLKRHGDGQGRWLAGSPDIRALTAWVDFLRSAQPGPDRHTGQVYLFDRQGRLALRTVDFPPAEQVMGQLEALSRQR
jgi:protein SCO1/2